MKLRTDFVSNSSSSSFLVLHIKNEVLAKLFVKHESAIRTFFSPESDFYGDLQIDETGISLTGGVPDAELGGDVPKKCDDLAWCMASLLTWGNVTEAEQIEDGEFDESLEALLRELFAQEEAIVHSVNSVHWEAGTDGYGESDGKSSMTFTYDPVNGASYNEEFTEGEEEDW